MVRHVSALSWRTDLIDLAIVIPVYNGSRYLGEALDSATAFGRIRTTTIVVDDGSTDGSADLVRSYALSHPGATLQLLSRANEGVSRARNAGIDEAVARWICFLDSDDLLQADAVERAITSAPSWAEMLWGGVSFLRVEGDSHPSARVIVSGKVRADRLAMAYLAGREVTSVCACVFRADFVRRYGVRFPPDVFYGEDQHFVLECLMRVRHVIVHKESFLCYRQHAASATARFRPRQVDAVRLFSTSALSRELVQRYRDIFVGYFLPVLALGVVKRAFPVRAFARNSPQDYRLLRRVLRRFNPIVRLTARSLVVFILRRSPVALSAFMRTAEGVRNLSDGARRLWRKPNA